MTVQSLHDVSERTHLLGGSVMFVAIGVVLIAWGRQRRLQAE